MAVYIDVLYLLIEVMRVGFDIYIKSCVSRILVSYNDVLNLNLEVTQLGIKINCLRNFFIFLLSVKQC